MFNRSKKVASQFDWSLMITVIILSIIGFFCIRSATAIRGLGWRSLTSQFLATAIGFLVIVVFQSVDMDEFQHLGLFLYCLAVLLLLYTLAFGYGETETGARSWVHMGPLSFQPSEFAKIGIIVSFAALLERYKGSISKIPTVLFLLISMGIPIFLILKQPDLGTAVVFVFLVAAMLFYSGIHWIYIVVAMGLAVVAAPLLFSHLSEYQKLRITNFLHPENDPMGSNYQILQGMIAIGSGKLTGQGYMQSTQTRFGFIPEQDSDYIFSALVEQFGFIGGVIVILLFFFLIFRIMIIAKEAKDEFERGLCVGVAAMIFIHVFENIGMTIGLMPVTGIPLPFLSNGGTFQLVNMTLIGMVLSVSTQRRPLDFNAEI